MEVPAPAEAPASVASSAEELTQVQAETTRAALVVFLEVTVV
jgi:hypothetical protein